MDNPPENGYTFSYWEHDVFLREVDLIIIGAGIVGLTAALHAKSQFPQWNIKVLERGMLPMGASTRNAGFACFGSISELLDDLSLMDENLVDETIKLRWQGLQLLRSIIPDSHIDYQQVGGMELFLTDDEYKTCAAKVDFFNHKMESLIGIKNTYVATTSAELIENHGLTGVKGYILNRHEGLLHPGKLIKYLLNKCRDNGIDVHFGASVNHIEESKGKVHCYLEGGLLKSQWAVIATNGFARKLMPEMEVYPARNQVLLTGPIEGLRLKAGFHMNAGYFYFRPVGNRVLIGGGRHLAMEEEATGEFGETSIIRNHLEQLLNENILPGIKYSVTNSWSGILGIGKEKKPIVRLVGNQIVLAVRMGGMGIAIGSVVGKQSIELIRFQV